MNDTNLREPRNPLAREPTQHLSPGARSRAMHAMSARAAQGRFVLQVCQACRAATYPPRDACPVCWGDLAWQDNPAGGTVLCETTIRASTDLYFRDRLPWRMGKVQLDAGPVALAHLHADLRPDDRVAMRLMLDRGGNAALVALPSSQEAAMNEADPVDPLSDPQWREFVVPIPGKTVLVSDARSAIGRALITALHQAGAATILAGLAPPARLDDATADKVLDRPGVLRLPLDITDQTSVTEALSAIPGPLDIVVNTARHVRPGGVSRGGNIVEQRRALEIAAIGLSRLAQGVAPLLATRPSSAFVDLISSDALAGSADQAGFAAAEAARLSLVQAFRHEMRSTGVRVMTVFTGPVDDEHHQTVPPPRVTPARIAAAIVDALLNGREQTCVGEVASDAMTRWLDDPALFVREKNL